MGNYFGWSSKAPVKSAQVALLPPPVPGKNKQPVDLMPATQLPAQDGNPLGAHPGMSSQKFLSLPPGVVNNSLEAVAYGTIFDPHRDTAMAPIWQPKFLSAADANTPGVRLAENGFEYGSLRTWDSYDNIYKEQTMAEAFSQKPMAAGW
jgi:hypothetical protein